MQSWPGIAGLVLAAGLWAAPLSAQVPGAPPAAPEPGPPAAIGTTVIEAPAASRNPDLVLPVMTLDQDALYRGSAWGLRVQADLERRGRQIADENDRLAEEFSTEEQELTKLRQTLPAEEFRKRADEFDKRVVEVRREREAALVELQTKAEEERTAFFRAALPSLTALMRERGALAILDQRAIFVAADSIDATDELIARIDAEIGAGPQAPPGTDSATDGGGQGAPNPANAPADQGAASPAEQAPVPAPPAQGQ